VEGVQQVSDSAGAKEPFLNNWDNEDAYTTSLVGMAQASDSAGATAPLFTKVQCSGVTAGKEINLDGGTAPSENHDVGREAFIPQMHQTEATKPLLADANCSKEAAEVFHGEGRGEEDTSSSKITKEMSSLVQNVGYYKGEPNSISQVGVSGREEPITNREDQGDEWHKNDPPYEEERCSDEALCHADEEQQCIKKSVTLGSDNEIGAISSNTTNNMIPTVEYENKRYRHAYIVKLPKTVDGFMISIGIAFDESPLLDEYYISFARYQRYKGDVMSQAKDLGVIKNVGDILVAIDGEDIAGKKMSEVLKMIEPKEVGGVLELTFVDRVAFNEHSYKQL
jgi:hypothetical protein